MAFGEIVPEIAGKRVIVGAKQLRKALSSGSVYRVFLALDADPAITETIEIMCQENSVEVRWARSMTELGKACGIDVGAAAAAALKNP